MPNILVAWVFINYLESNAKIIELSQRLWQVGWGFWKKSCCLKINCNIEGLPHRVWQGMPTIYPPQNHVASWPGFWQPHLIDGSNCHFAAGRAVSGDCVSQHERVRSAWSRYVSLHKPVRKHACFYHCSTKEATSVGTYGLGSRKKISV